MPFELFDPNEQAHFTTFVDSDVRIIWAAGGRIKLQNGGRIIFVRRQTPSKSFST